MMVGVSPGFTPRPWLSASGQEPVYGFLDVSPGFTTRPWLSVAVLSSIGNAREACVAGVYAPALVERGRAPTTGTTPT